MKRWILGLLAALALTACSPRPFTEGTITRTWSESGETTYCVTGIAPDPKNPAITICTLWDTNEWTHYYANVEGYNTETGRTETITVRVNAGAQVGDRWYD